MKSLKCGVIINKISKFFKFGFLAGVFCAAIIFCVRTFALPIDPDGFELVGLIQGQNTLYPDNYGIYRVSNYWNGLSLHFNLHDVDTDGLVAMISTDFEKGGEIFSSANDVTQTNLAYATDYSGLADYSISHFIMNPNAEYSIFHVDFYRPTIVDGAQQLGDALISKSFKVLFVDYDENKTPKLEIIAVRQLGEEVLPEESFGNYTYHLDRNYDYEVDVIGSDLPSGIIYTYYPGTSRHINYHGDELEEGITAHVNVNHSFTMSNYNYSNAFGKYLQPTYNGGSVYFTNSYVQDDDPYYSVTLRYANSGEVVSEDNKYGEYHHLSGTVDPDEYDPINNPLEIYIKGENYDDERDYRFSWNIYYGNELVLGVGAEATGAEIEEGIVIPFDAEMRYETLNSLLNGTFDEQAFDIEVSFAGATKSIAFLYNDSVGGVRGEFFATSGLPFASYSNMQSAAGGNWYVEMGSITVYEEAFDIDDDDAYIVLQNNTGLDGLHYYVYYHDLEMPDNYYDTYERLNSLVGAEKMLDGMIGNNAFEVHKIRNHRHYQNPAYTIVTTRDGRVVYVQHLIANRSLYHMGPQTIPVYAALMGSGEDEFITSGSNYYNVITPNNFYVRLYADEVDSEALYEINIVAKKNSGEVVYENTSTMLGENILDHTSLITLPYDLAESASNTNINVSITIFSSQINKGGSTSFTLYYPSDTSYLRFSTIEYNDIINNIRTRESMPKSFVTYFEADETFGDEIDVYLKVGGYTNLSYNCDGICGLVGELEYDTDKIELVSMEPLAGFESEFGNKIVLYSPTGADSDSAILKLRFRNVGLVQNEETTISFVNAQGSDGVDNIDTSDTEITIKHVEPVRAIMSTTFNADGQQIFARAGSAGTVNGAPFSGALSPIYKDLFDANDVLIFYYQGFGFDDEIDYNYSLKYREQNSETSLLVASGTILGSDLNDGKLRLEASNTREYDRAEFVLEISNSDVLVYSYIGGFTTWNDSDIYATISYGYSSAPIVNGYVVIPYNTAFDVSVLGYNLEEDKEYELVYQFVDYASCGYAESDGMIVGGCIGDEESTDANISRTLTVSGKELMSGLTFEIPAPRETTVRRTFEIDVLDRSQDEYHQTVAFKEALVEFFDAGEIITDLDEYVVEDGIIQHINPGSTTGALTNNLAIGNGFTVLIQDKSGNLLTGGDLIGTGAKIQIRDSDDQAVMEYTVKIIGDLSGDGKITVLDLVQAKRDLAGLNKVTGIFAEAGDVTRSGYIGITDIVKICRHVAGIEEIRQ